ncbi:ankyrin repeat domain-containing protein [Pacificibacter marinus]|uniref:ankyrin repeat domain-containing protein n=1 Tax=Pacificibacter marinus TaxID=658057 RepID=UPI001C0A1FD0|nr:ankyrin repeat domain-containing protein [Pacificibacter marinus]
MASYGPVENIFILANAGADLSARDNHGGTPLHVASQFGTPENVEMLLKAGANGAALNDVPETPSDLVAGNPSFVDIGLDWTGKLLLTEAEFDNVLI